MENKSQDSNSWQTKSNPSESQQKAEVSRTAPKFADVTSVKAKRKIPFVLIIITIISLLGASLGIYFLIKKTDSTSVRIQCGQGSVQFTKSFVLGKTTKTYPWWDDKFSYYQQISIKNNNTDLTLPTECWIEIEFDHAELVDSKKSQFDGIDLRIVYFENENYRELPFELSDTNTQRTTIEFQLAKNLVSNDEDASYFLYYGNAVAVTNESLITDTTDDKIYAENISIEKSDEVHPKILGSLSRKWVLIGKNIDESYTDLTYSVEIDESIKPSSTPNYEIIGTDKRGELDFVFRGEYEANIDVSNLSAGTYEIQTTVISEKDEYTSPKTHILISYPIYVSFTVDWEGYDVPYKELEELLAFSERHHNVPTTHFFNPRIYVTSDVTEEQAAFLTQWIQIRKLNGDDIGMHLHMHHDLVQAAGVTPRTNPKWTNTLNNGHDVPCSAYTYDEFDQIVRWAKEEFLQQGLGVPISFRAGGWFADLKVLKVLDANGFLVESSGREAYAWGANGIPGHWNLSTTAQPYRPSSSNQNSTNPPPQLDLWEFPNNGGNSYFEDVNYLIDRFNENYNRKPQMQPHAVNYLTHPHAFTEDTEVLDPAFNYVDEYLAEKDNGPVIYITLENAYKNWET